MRKLTELLKNIESYTLCGNSEIGISGITLDSRECRKGDIFTCITGFLRDGHEYAPKAVENGASAILTDNFASLEKAALKGNLKLSDVTVIAVDNVRDAFAKISSALNGNPSAKMSLIGITGTKGKTTTSYMMRNILQKAGPESGLIGTICNYVGKERIETERTTPEANVIQDLLGRMVSENITKCIMEVSSQGLHLNRVGECRFSTAVFTNLSRDHIGASEHATMEDYARAKAKLFSMAERSLINCDNDWSEFMLGIAKETCANVYTYGIDGECNFKAVNIVKKSESVEYDVLEDGVCKMHITVPIPGRFTIYNSLAAYAAMRLEGLSPEIIADGLSDVFVPGKAEIVPTGRDFTVLIDYAHNPDSFINILTTVKEFAKRTVFLFGCGGDRNRPRALMGETAGKYADFTIITSDNPRSEDPESIVRDLEAGIKPTGADYVCIVNRKEAIFYAIKNARPGDVIILAGKGHETYQILKDRTIHFDEREVVKEALECLK